MGSLSEFLLLANAVSTWFMAGVIWYVQIVHYPLFARVGTSGFVAYEDAHSRLTTLVVAPPMLVEITTTFLLLVFPPDVPYSLLVVGAILVAVIWASTALLQVPRHTRLGAGFDVDAHRLLVVSNWLRTTAWTFRAGIVFWLLTGSL